MLTGTRAFGGDDITELDPLKRPARSWVWPVAVGLALVAGGGPEAANAASLVVVQNWAEEVKARLPAAKRKRSPGPGAPAVSALHAAVPTVCGQGRMSWVKRRRGTAGTPRGHDPHIVSSLSRRLMD